MSLDDSVEASSDGAGQVGEGPVPFAYSAEVCAMPPLKQYQADHDAYLVFSGKPVCEADLWTYC